MICNQYQAYYQVIDDALSDYKCPVSAAVHWVKVTTKSLDLTFLFILHKWEC